MFAIYAPIDRNVTLHRRDWLQPEKIQQLDSSTQLTKQFLMACFPVIQMTEGEWRSSKYWDVLGVNISLTFTDDPDKPADYISNFETRPDDVFVVSYPKSGLCCLSLY